MKKSDRSQAEKIPESGPGIRLTLLIAAAVFGLWTGCEAAVTIPAPAWMELTPVAEKMVVGGLPSTVLYFRAKRKPEEVIAFYRKSWDEGGSGRSGYREADGAPWRVISRLEDRYLMTVQVKEKDAFTSDGYLATADLKEVRAESKKAGIIPSLQGSDIVNDLTSYDPGSKSRTVMLVNGYSVARNSDYYRDYYLERGWGQAVDQQKGDSSVLVFGKNGSQSHLVISAAGSKTRVVMNLIEEK